MKDVLGRFHAAVAGWFRDTYAEPTDCQVQAWAAIKQGRHALIAAPTGSGKTLAAFLSAIDDLAREADGWGLPNETRVLYVSPLRALSHDVHRNLELPLDGINRRLAETSALAGTIRAQTRTGDTPAAMRVAMARQPPHILVTTPESLYVLLTTAGGRRMLRSVRTVIVDELHAVVATKRGAHLALSLERLGRLTGRPVVRIGLSATQKPIDEMARFLTGATEDCAVIGRDHRRSMDLAIELPQLPLAAVLGHQASGQIYDRMAELIQAHDTTLVFVNTRRLAERVAFALTERLGDSAVTAHHGSLSREQRLDAENRLRGGRLRALVATASLELGIDVGAVDLVCQWGSTGSIATLLQRVGRSGHGIGGMPKGRVFPTTRDDLLECMALIQSVCCGELEHQQVMEQPLDVLAQQVVAMVSVEDWAEDELYRCIVRAHPYRGLNRAEFDEVIRMIAEGYGAQGGIRGAHVCRDGINQRLRAGSGARLTAVTCGGAIPDPADYLVILEPGEELLGTVDEHFAIESVVGDVFQLGNASWRLLRMEGETLRVADAEGQLPSIPFWFGEAPGRSDALSESLSRLRHGIDEQLDRQRADGVKESLRRDPAFPAAAVEQAVNYLAETKAALGVVPTRECVVVERFFDDSGGMQLILHAPFGSRVNRAWGLALRKRFCRTFNFELQAAANEDALLLSLGTSQSFALEDIRHYLKPSTVRDLLVQALLDAPMFLIRWRWNAMCSLAIKRFEGGRKIPPHLLRIQAEDLITQVFPDQLACLENIVGDRKVPDHPLVGQTIRDCLSDAMNIDRFVAVLSGIASGTIRMIFRDIAGPSPLADGILHARVYSFLDGAPLEERRTRAVGFRPQWGRQSLEFSASQVRSAVHEVRREAWPTPANAEEFHQALMVSGFVFESEGVAHGWQPHLQDLIREKRATRLVLAEEAALWIAAERWPQVRAVYPGWRPEPPLHLPHQLECQAWGRDQALTALLRLRLAIVGPVDEFDLSRQLMLAPSEIRAALSRLENEGYVLRGGGVTDDGWCERGLAIRIQRYRRGTQGMDFPVTAHEFAAFLFRWHRLHPETRVNGGDGVCTVLSQLEGFAAPLSAWDGAILPARVERYTTADLDRLGRVGRFIWLSHGWSGDQSSPICAMPIALPRDGSVASWPYEAAPSAGGSQSPDARVLQRLLDGVSGAAYHELVAESGLGRQAADRALAELVATGAVTSESFAGLRALSVPEDAKRKYRGIDEVQIPAGRWFSTRNIGTPLGDGAEYIARVLLRRYGVIFEALLVHEQCVPPWQRLVQVYRRLEASGEIRGGHFVAGPYGEQYAFPEALAALYSGGGRDSAEAWVSAADPLNLVGILSEGTAIPARSGKWILYRNGDPVALDDGQGRIETLGDERGLGPPDGLECGLGIRPAGAPG